MGPKDYTQLLAHIKEQIRTAQVRTASAANSQMLLLYWQLGNLILENQKQKGWGAKIVQMLAADLKKEFPEMKGFSQRNLVYMRQFAENYPPLILQAYIFAENKLKSSVLLQQSMMELLQANKMQFTQHPVAQLEQNEKYTF